MKQSTVQSIAGSSPLLKPLSIKYKKNKVYSSRTSHQTDKWLQTKPCLASFLSISRKAINSHFMKLSASDNAFQAF